MNIRIETHSLEDHIAFSESFLTAYLRVLGSITSSQGLPSLTEYSIIAEIAEHADEPAVASVVVLNALENPRPLPLSLMQLKKVSDSASNDVRKSTFEAARPLLQLHGFKSRGLAKRLAESLNYEVSNVELDEFLCAEDQPWFQKIKRSSSRLIKGNKLRDLADLSFNVTRDVSVSKYVIQYEDGLISQDQLRDHLRSKCKEIMNQINSFEHELNTIEIGTAVTNVFSKTAYTLQQQINKKLAVLEARLHFEKTAFNEDIDDIVHDAGNAFEVAATERLRTDQWKNPAVWESIAKSSSKELESRINRASERRANILQLLKEELSLFQDDINFSALQFESDSTIQN